jgi:tRNA-Thr(GGU) m(6)t(6)A37 methyltransferase TsaA
MTINLTPIATVKNTRTQPTDDHWTEVSIIQLAPHIPAEAFDNIETFSHLEIIYYFDKIDFANIVYHRRPRGNAAWPDMGIFAQRNKDRPNGIGLCTVELIKHEGRTLHVRRLDAIDGTPVLDIKPVFREFQPAGPTRQPDWVSQLTKEYWD